MTLEEKLVSQETVDIVEWKDRLIRARNARASWDADYERASKILANDVSDFGYSKNNLSSFTDKFFHTNWLLKLCIFMEGYISSADVMADIKSHNGSDDISPDRMLLEMELNNAASKFEIVDKWIEGVVPSRCRFGYGVNISGWDTMNRDPYWRNGKPDFQTLDPRRAWVDESANEINFQNRRWVFIRMLISVDDAKLMFPDHADEIVESRPNSDYGDPDNMKGMYGFFLCQYNKKVQHRMVDIEITEEQIVNRKQVLLEEVQDLLAQREANGILNMPENVRVLSDMDDNDGEPGYEARFSAAFQFYFSDDDNIQLSDVEYIGDIDQVQFWTYHRIPNDIYPRGISYMLKDEQALKTIMLTKAAIEVIKDGRQVPLVREGAIRDIADYKQNHNSMNYVAEISNEWTMTHPGVKPIEFTDIHFNPAIIQFMNTLLQNEMQELTGGTDSMMGQAQYSGMSAAQTGLLQSSGATYTETDKLSYRKYARSVFECYMRQIAEYLTYEHTIDGASADGKSQTVTVNQFGINNYDWQKYYIEPVIENNPEAIKQLKKQEAMQLKGMGSMGTVRMLTELGYSNAEQIVEEAQSEQGILEVVQKLQENPELIQLIMNAPVEQNKTQTTSNQ